MGDGWTWTSGTWRQSADLAREGWEGGPAAHRRETIRPARSRRVHLPLTFGWVPLGEVVEVLARAARLPHVVVTGRAHPRSSSTSPTFVRRCGSEAPLRSGDQGAAGHRMVTGSRGEDKPKEIVVFSITKDATCDECGVELWSGNLLRLWRARPTACPCRPGSLVYLPSGDCRPHPPGEQTLRPTGRRRAVEPQPQALRTSGHPGRRGGAGPGEEECLSDADLRAARRAREAEGREKRDETFVRSFAEAIADGTLRRRQEPRCPLRARLPEVQRPGGAQRRSQGTGARGD